MSHTIHTLTELEQACGVTLNDVARELPRVYMPDSDTAVLPDGLTPALAKSVARASIGASEYAGHNALGLPVYRSIN